jgi:DNA polymerase-3 subunit delta
MPVYFFYGPEDYLLDQAVEDVIAAARPAGSEENVELVRLDAEGLTPTQLGAELQLGALFASCRIIVFKKPYWLRSDARKVKYAREVEDLLTDYLAEPPAEQILILTAQEKSASNKIAKLLSSHPAVTTQAVAPWPAARMQAWVRAGIEQAGKRIRDDAVQRIVSSGQDQYYIKNLLDKLVLLPETDIDAVLLQDHLDDKTEIKVFKLLDGVFSRNLPAASVAFYRLLRQGEAPAYIAFMLFRQFYYYSWIKALHEQDCSSADIERLTGQKAFTVKSMLRHARRFSWPEIEGFLAALLQLNIDMKSTGKDAQMQLECILARWVRTNKEP